MTFISCAKFLWRCSKRNWQ